MKRFKKYEFDTEEQADLFIDNLGFKTFDGVKNRTHNNDIVKLGNIVTTWPTFDEDMNELTPAVLSEMFSVDVLWHDIKDKDWKASRIKLNGKKSSHSFMGHEYSDDTV